MRQTVSFCPECYKKIPADIVCKDGAMWMVKTCSDHGQTASMVERDPEYWFRCMENHAPDIYKGYLVETTERCSLKCKYCFYPRSNKPDRSMFNILQEVQMARGFGPYILTGGEPTMRDDLPEIAERMKVFHPHISTLTNGVGMEKHLDKVLPHLFNINGVVGMELSMHKESNGKDYELIQNIRERGLKLNSVLFVIDDLSQIDEIVDFARNNTDAVNSIRIKVATRLWNEGKPESRIFVSDMLNYIKDRWPIEYVWWKHNKVGFFNISLFGMWVMLVNWYDVTNVDLMEINCPPYYLANNGVIENFLTSCLINEGMKKGWLNGRRINAC